MAKCQNSVAAMLRKPTVHKTTPNDVDTLCTEGLGANEDRTQYVYQVLRLNKVQQNCGQKVWEPENKSGAPLERVVIQE